MDKVQTHRLNIRAAYRAALLDIVGGDYEATDLRCEDLLDSMVQHMAERAGTRVEHVPAHVEALADVLKALDKGGADDNPTVG